MASGLTGNEVPGNRLRVRVSCPPLVFLGKYIIRDRIDLQLSAGLGLGFVLIIVSW